MNIQAQKGAQVKYVGATDEQVKFGNNDDPRGVLVVGGMYTVQATDVHTWHTKIELQEYPGLRFNSVSFVDYPPKDEPESEPTVLTGYTCGPEIVPSHSPTDLSSALTHLAADVLKCRTYGAEVPLRESETIDDRLLDIARRLIDLSVAERNKLAPLPPASNAPKEKPVEREVPPLYSIPPMVHPLSKGWTQPSVESIRFDGDCARMTMETFGQLMDYTGSTPTGVYAGKMWKSQPNPGGAWYLVWFSDVPGSENTCRTTAVRIHLCLPGERP
jgi:hypothetical protein